jgi:hypothetical protein
LECPDPQIKEYSVIADVPLHKDIGKLMIFQLCQRRSLTSGPVLRCRAERATEVLQLDHQTVKELLA